MHSPEWLTIMPPPPTGKVTFSKSTVIPDLPTGPALERPLTFRFVVGVLRRKGECRRKRVKDLWRKIWDLMRKDHSD